MKYEPGFSIIARLNISSISSLLKVSEFVKTKLASAQSISRKSPLRKSILGKAVCCGNSSGYCFKYFLNCSSYFVLFLIDIRWSPERYSMPTQRLKG
jgi:hypothetical protein